MKLFLTSISNKVRNPVFRDAIPSLYQGSLSFLNVTRVYGTQAIYFTPVTKMRLSFRRCSRNSMFKSIIIHLLLSQNFARIGQFMWTVEGEINLCPTAWYSLRRFLRPITNQQPFGISFIELYPYR